MIYTSASQLETLDLCARKLAFQSILKLPRQKQASQEFGSILHSVAERYLKGEPELYPDGWDVDEESKTKLSVTDAAMVQMLVKKAIDEGHIERCPDSEVEEEFKIDYPSFAVPVRLVGYKDHQSMFFARVEDHKTSKNDSYLFGPTKLKRSIQMMIYGYDLLVEAERRGLPKPAIVTLRHNQFVKNPEFPYVTHAQAEVTSAEIEEFMRSRIVPLIEQRVKLQGVKNPLKEIPDPKPSACNAYGGCPFRNICGGYESTLQYTARINRLNNPSPVSQALPMTNPNDFLARRAAINPPAAAAPAAPAAAPAEPAIVPGTPGPSAVATSPPWTSSTCPACRGTGWNSRKQPCRICIAATKKSPDAYEWQVGADGATVTWWKKGELVATTPTTPVATQPATQRSYSISDFSARLTAAKDEAGVAAVLHDATTMLSAVDIATLTMAAEARLDELDRAAAPVAPAPQPTTTPAPAVTIAPKDPAPAEPAPAAVEQPAAPAPKERKPRASKAAAAPVEASPATAGGEPPCWCPNVILLVGCAKPASWPGYTVLTAEEVLGKIEGYWNTVTSSGAYDTAAAFRRRDAVRASISGGQLPEGMTSVVVVQQFRDPDTTNLMAALATLPGAVLVTGVTL